jgi:hypothetical protein
MAIFKHKIGKLGSPNKKQIKNNQFNMISGEMALSSPTRLTDKRHTMYQQADNTLKKIFQGSYSSSRESRDLEQMPSIQQIEQDVKRRKYYGNLIGYTTTQAFTYRSNKFDALKQIAYVDAQLAQDTLP